MNNGDGFISQGPVGAMRVRAAMVDDSIYVCLADLMDYVGYPGHNLDDDARQAVASLLQRLGEALESD